MARLGILKTNFIDDTAALYAYRGKRGFEDVTMRSGLGVETRYVNWGAAILDLDNDGLSRPVLGNRQRLSGSREEVPGVSPQNSARALSQPGQRQVRGTVDRGRSRRGAPRTRSRGCAFGDFDNDGDLDLLIVNLNEPPSLLRNDVKAENHWLKLKLQATKSNRSAIGARALVRYGGRRQVQEITGQAGFLSVNDRRLHFGLGVETTADVEVRWPSGIVQNFKGVAADRLVTIDETRGIVDSRPFKTG